MVVSSLISPKTRFNLVNDSTKGLVLDVISNMASMDAEISQELVDRGVIPVMILFIRDECEPSKAENEALRITSLESAVWTLGNLAGGDIAIRNLVIEAGALDLFMDVVYPLFPEAKGLTKILIWAISNLPRGGPFPDSVRLPSLFVPSPVDCLGTKSSC